MPPKRKAAPKRKKDESSEEESFGSSESDNEPVPKRASSTRTSSRSFVNTKEEESDEEEVEEEEEEVSALVDQADPSKARTLQEAGKFGLKWKKMGTFYFLDSDQIKPSEKIIGFDMDSTLIEPKSKGKFPSNRKDWKWLSEFNIEQNLKTLHEEGWKIVIFTNQAGIEKDKVRDTDITGKILDICATLGFPMQACIAAATDGWRKPHTSMWDFMVKYMNGGIKPDLKHCIFVGDAAGRPKEWKPKKKKDFSCTDRTFGHNIGIKFQTPEEFFLKEGAASFEWEGIDPAAVLERIARNPPKTWKNDELVSKDQEVVICVGCPASGKSTLARNVFVPAGYVHVNQDTLKTKDKCIKAAREAVEQGKSVIIDNTNGAADVRANYVKIAAAKGIPVRCVRLTTDWDLAHHLNYFRERILGVRRIPDVAYNTFKKNFKEPVAEEGFKEIITIDWVPTFASEDHKRFFLHRTC